ncbi:MAG: SDR family NAD(P)-dependent oxidoreductase, partial [Rhodospirillales bacterium]
MRLKDKVCVITGAAQGIGEACALRFAREGAKVVVSDIQLDKGEAVAGAIRDAGGEAIYVACDVSRKSDCDDLIAAAVAAYGRIDVHLSNAAVLVAKDFLDLTEDDWNKTIAVNLTGFFYAGQSAAAQMVKQGSGTIINMSSINAVVA